MRGLIFLLLLCPLANADNHRYNPTETSTTTQTGGDITHDILALGFSGSDVDINQCYRSFSYLIIYQDTNVNPLCLAQQLVAEGRYAAAAKLRCQPRDVRRAFGGKQECIAELSTPPNLPVIPVVMSDVIIEEDDDEYRQLNERLDQFEAERAAQLLATQRAARSANAAAAEVRAEQAAEKAYAQQTLEELKKYGN